MASPRRLILVALAACGYADPRNVCTPPTPDDACPAPPDTCADGLGLQLVTIQPSLVSPGDTIMLEGTFSQTEPTNVIFPGGTDQPATVMPGGHRARVNAPPNARTGDLFVKTGPYCLGPARFRSVSFGSMLRQFGNAPELTSRRTHSAALVVNDSLYVLGGDSGDKQALSSVEHAPITTSGLGSFEPINISLVTARAQHTIAVVGEWLYVLGGVDDHGKALTSIERARISSDGELGPFDMVEKGLRTPRLGHSSVVIGNRLYVLGGASSTTGGIATTGADIQYATIAASGDLDEFVEIPVRVPKPIGGTVRIGAVSMVFGNSLYLLGGYYRSPDVNDSTKEVNRDALPNVDKASISGDGSLDEFRPEGALLVHPRAEPALAVIGRHLYLFGGFNFVNGISDNYLQSNEETVLESPPTTFVSIAPLGKARGGAAAAVIGNSICVLGGQEKGGVDGPPRLNTVECAPSLMAE